MPKAFIGKSIKLIFLSMGKSIHMFTIQMLRLELSSACKQSSCSVVSDKSGCKLALLSARHAITYSEAERRQPLLACTEL